MKKIVIIFMLFISAILYSQGSKSGNDLYENPTGELEDNDALLRNKWFYEQRVYPYDYIPENAYVKAYYKKENLKKDNGYMIN